MNLSVLLADRAAEFGSRKFLFFERQPVHDESNKIDQACFKQTLSFRELDNRVNQACHYLSSLGLNRGDVFNLHLPNCPAFLILWFAGARLGAVMMPTNVLASAEELGYLLEHSSSKLAFTTTENLQTLNQCQRNIDCLEAIILCDPCSDDPALDSFEALLQKQPDTCWSCPANETDMAAIMYTSGTTSKPKGVIVTHANYITAGQAVADASELDEKVATRIVEARRSVAEKIIRNYCIGKGLLVAVNPVPIADLLAAAGTAVAMVIHLGEVYGFRLSRREASKLLLTISAQLLALMGAYWGMNLVSSALKTASAGLSIALTAAAQGALAWYATYVTGKMAETWFSKGKSWGANGPADTARLILASLDRDSLISTARTDILNRLKRIGS